MLFCAKKKTPALNSRSFFMEVRRIELLSGKVNQVHLQVQLCEVVVGSRQQHNKRRLRILIKSPRYITETVTGKSRQVKEHLRTRNRAPRVPALLCSECFCKRSFFSFFFFSCENCSYLFVSLRNLQSYLQYKISRSRRNRDTPKYMLIQCKRFYSSRKIFIFS